MKILIWLLIQAWLTYSALALEQFSQVANWVQIELYPFILLPLSFKVDYLASHSLRDNKDIVLRTVCRKLAFVCVVM